ACARVAWPPIGGRADSRVVATDVIVATCVPAGRSNQRSAFLSPVDACARTIGRTPAFVTSTIHPEHEDRPMATATAPVTAPDKTILAKGYVHPELLVSTDWLASNLDNPSIRVIESDEDVLLYDMGHIPNAQKVDWHADLND